MKKIIITIDGYVATGKGTTAMGLARRLGYTYLDTGAMYRAVARYAREHGLLEANEEIKAQMMRQIILSFHYNSQTDHNDIYLNGRNIEKEIRQTTLSSIMKPIVVSPIVRKELRRLQREIGFQGGIVVDGRDMGTIVFPDAELKLFLVGDIDVRVERRYREMISKGITVTRDEIRHDILTRDNTDYLSSTAVNNKADDAIIINTTDLTIDEQIHKSYMLVKDIVK